MGFTLPPQMGLATEPLQTAQQSLLPRHGHLGAASFITLLNGGQDTNKVSM